MSDPSPIYSFFQLCLLAAPFLLLVAGVRIRTILGRRRPWLGWVAVAAPVILFVGVAAATCAQHWALKDWARKDFLSGLIIVPEQLVPGRVLTLTMYGEGPGASYFHLTRTGAATEVITALENGTNWRHDGTNPVLNLSAADLFYLNEPGEIGVTFMGALEDVDYIFVTGHLADFIAMDPDRWGALEELGYDLGLVSLLYDVSDGLPINLATSEPIFRFASTRSVYLRLPNWSTDWSLGKLLEWEDFTPAPVAGQTRFDVLADRLAPTK